jgi:hypothetical protein
MRALGQYFDGDQTDWEHVRAAVAWANELHAVGIALPEETRRLLAGPHRALAPIRAACEQVLPLWQTWACLADFLARAFTLTPLLPTGQTAQNTEVSTMRTVLCAHL